MEKYDEIHVYLESGRIPDPNYDVAFYATAIVSGQGHFIRNYGGVFLYCTSDEVAYTALLQVLPLVAVQTSRKVIVFTDNDLLIKQMNGSYKVTGPKLIRSNCNARILELEFKEVIYKNLIEGDDQWAYSAYKYKRQLIKSYLKKYCCGSSLQIEKTKKKKKEDQETLTS